MPPHANQDLEQTLDRHGSFVRRLARSLVFDENRAEDVAQETWLAAAKHPPRDPASTRGWLARVARNFSFRMRRDDARRRAREERVARPEVVAPKAGSPPEAMLLREVIESVLALEEPYRSTVLMRYYENLEPAEIAARGGVPPATVRTRLKRALDQLRERFDAEHGGSRSSWTAPLLPLALGALKPVAVVATAAAAGGALVTSTTTGFQGITLGGVLMAKKIGIISGLAAVAVVSVVIANRSFDDAPEVPEARPGVTIAEAPAVAKEEPAARLQEGPITAKPYVPLDEDRVVFEAPRAEKGAPSATIIGRVLDQRGVPQGNVPVSLRTLEITVDESLPFTTNASNEREAKATTGQDGRFSFPDLPLNVEARVRARPETLCDVARPVPLTKPGVVDLGDLVALPGGSIAGVVTGPSGTALKGCRVTAYSTEGTVSSSLGMISFRRFVDPDLRSAITNAEGKYRIDGLPEGACAVNVAADEHPGDLRHGVHVRTSEVTWEIDFKLAAGATLAGVVRDGDGRPMPGVSVAATVAEPKFDGLEGGHAERSRKTTTGTDGRFVLQGLRAEPANLRARKPGFVSATQRGVTPGTSDIVLTLQPCGIAFGHVRNAITNEPVAEFGMRVENEGFAMDGGPRPKVVRGAEAAKLAGVVESPGLFAIVDLPETPVQVHVHAENFADAEVGPVRAASGAKIEVNALLSPQAMVKGVVVDAAGSPVEGARVSISNSKSDDVPDGGGRRVWKRRRVVARGEAAPSPVDEPNVSRSVVTGPDGAFTIKSLPGASYKLSATHRAYAGSTPAAVEVKAGGLAEGVRLVLELGGTFAGTAFDSEGNKMAGARVMLRAKGGADEQGDRFIGDGQAGISNNDGDFEITGLKPGQYHASLEAPAGETTVEISIPSFDREEGGLPVAIEAGKTTRRDLRLDPVASLSGLVKEGGKPAPGIKVSLNRKGVPEFLSQNSTRTSEDGTFTFSKVAPGEYSVVVDPPGAAIPIRKAVALAPRAEQRVTIDLPTGAIEGRVTDKATGKPVQGATVSVTIEEGGPERVEVTTGIMVTATADDDGGGVQTISIGGASDPVRTDADGKYRLRYVEAGKYRVALKGASMMPQSRSGVAVEEGRTVKDVDFEMTKGATLSVTIDPAGHDVNQVIGFLNIDGGNPENREMASGSVKNGMKFSGLKPGKYHLRLDAPMSELEGQTDVEIAAGEEARVTVRLVEQQ